ncbi:thiamine-phosphate synthase [Enterococcus florum]|uniref:Thiamine-phosphate synthase n=1 Tax=Enterococcus florum TaxID=2480627 RepID=A0A4V0WPM5_9ENTE|nr:thiamine phosphate synthase [Enterococcus florum]GCF94379.1 thiamine-phosphate synthase [Enterococcus florum]
MNKEALTLYLVTERYDFSDEKFLAILETACQAGVTLVQLREKTATTHRFYELAVKVKAVTDRYGIPLIINDRIDICLAVDAAGVHIGDDELPVEVARRLIGPDRWLGVSSKTVTRSLEAQQAGADYLGVGAIFPTKTKDSALTPVTTLKTITAQVSIPVVAIGGINTENISQLEDSGAAGVSVVSCIMKAEDVFEKVKQLHRESQRVLY